MLVKLGVSSVQCEVGQRQRGYTIPSIVGENKEDIDGSTCRRGVMSRQCMRLSEVTNSFTVEFHRD